MSLSDNDITAKNFQEFYNRIKPFLNQTAPSGFTPIGTVISVMGKTAPENYLVCDGTAYNILEYPELAVYIKDQFGSYNYFGGDGTNTFAVPDLRGEFLRGTGTNSHANQGSGANVGEHQDGTEHWFASSGTDLAAPANAGAVVVKTDSVVPKTAQRNVVARRNVDSSATIFTSRPTNTSVLYCIAYKNIFIDVKQVYSLNERVIGTWIDGKPLYQKTMETTNIPSSGNGELTDFAQIFANLNIDTIFKVSSYAIRAGVPLSEYFVSVNDCFSLAVFPDTVWYKQVSAATITKVVLTVQYTKTTD